MDRRRFLTVTATATAAALAGAAGNDAAASAAPNAGLRPPPFALLKTPVFPGTLTWLPGQGDNMALTIDDGQDPATVAAFVQFAQDTGARLTFFVTGAFPGWLANRDALRPLVESGQVQLANHTWDHPDLVTVPAGAVADQLNRTSEFLRNNFGVDGRPYFRPPYGNHNEVVDKVAADLGYTIPVNWSGQLEEYPAKRYDERAIVDLARTHFRPQAIVLAHANAPAITHVYGQLCDIIKDRNLALVTLDDVLAPWGCVPYLPCARN